MNPALDPYPDGFLQRLSAVGVNGVWLHVVLRDLAPGGTTFPEFGADHERRLANLRILVQRAKKYGVGVYLYMNEPRAMPASFFKNRPEMGGVREDEFTALCTSHPAVRQWMARCAGARVSPSARPGRRLCDHGVGEPDQLRFAWRLAIVRALQDAHATRTSSPRSPP